MYKVKMDGCVLYHAEHPSAALIDPELELEPGYAGVFTATVPPENPLYDKIFCRRSMISVFRNDREIFYGEVRKIPNIDRQKNKQIYCTGALSFLADSIQPQAKYTDVSGIEFLSRLIDIHNSQVEPRKQMQLGIVSTAHSNERFTRTTDFENTLDVIRNKLIANKGGYLRLRHENYQLILDWVDMEQYGNYSTQPIEFGLNLLDYAETSSAENVVTALIPLGAAIESEEIGPYEERIGIEDVNNGKNYVCSQDAVNQFGWVWATNIWEDITSPDTLKENAQTWLSTTQFETMTLTLTAADLSDLGRSYDAFAEGDRIHCLAKPYGMDIVLPVMKLSIPLLNSAGITLELSLNKQKTFTEQQSAAQNEIIGHQDDTLAQSNRNIQISINNMTSMMTGARGGYKLSEYDEAGRWVRDLYMDTPDKTTAQRIMQINKDGIAASVNGYEGPYTVGITVDGQILGDWIAAHSIDTEHLTVGLNGRIVGLEDGLETKVEKDGLISAINQSAEAVSINASKINLNGSVTANSHFKIKTDGSMEANAGKIGGFNINSDYIAFGDYIEAANWLSMCTPHGGAGDVYIGKGGISTDSYSGSSSEFVKSIKLSEGEIGFYKGSYPCGFLSLGDGGALQIRLLDGDRTGILDINNGFAEFPVNLRVEGNLNVAGEKSRIVKTCDYGERLLYAYETPTPYFGDIGEGVIAEDGICFVAIDPVFAQCVSLDTYQVFLQPYDIGDLHLIGRFADCFKVSGTPGMHFGWEIKARQINEEQLRLERETQFSTIPTPNYGLEAAAYITSLKEGRINT